MTGDPRLEDEPVTGPTPEPATRQDILTGRRWAGGVWGFPETPIYEPGVHVPTWAQSRLWPGWERDAFVEWIEAQGGYSSDPWASYAEWWRVEGMWR
jgi:hypothetical protein